MDPSSGPHNGLIELYNSGVSGILAIQWPEMVGSVRNV